MELRHWATFGGLVGALASPDRPDPVTDIRWLFLGGFLLFLIAAGIAGYLLSQRRGPNRPGGSS